MIIVKVILVNQKSHIFFKYNINITADGHFWNYMSATKMYNVLQKNFKKILLQNDQTILGQEFYSVTREFSQYNIHSSNQKHHPALVLKVILVTKLISFNIVQSTDNQF